MVSEVDALIGRVIAGKFVVESYLGGGAMGAVYRARQTSLDKVVAIKVLRSALAGDKLFAARFHREAKAASKLDHPGSIRILDHGEEPDGLLYIVMEYLDGRNLFRVIHEEWPLAHDRIVNILSQVLAALAVAHDAGILHRDLKPENIMVASGIDDEGYPVDHVKVCDFGIAKIVDGGTRARETPDSDLQTIDGLVIGTPEYMSPEQGRGEPLDARSDLYSVGVILYQLLCNQVPFDADSPLGIVMRHIMEEPVPPSRIYPRVDAHLEAVCLRALQKGRGDRFQSAREMRTELRALFGPSLPLAMPGAAPSGASGTSGELTTPSPHAAGVARDLRRPSRVPTLAFGTPAAHLAAPAAGDAHDDAHDDHDDAHGHGTLALLSGSVLPPPRPRSRFWPIASAVLILASTAAAGIVATGGSVPRLASSSPSSGDPAPPARAPRIVDRTDSMALRRSAENRVPRTAAREPAESDVAPAKTPPLGRGARANAPHAPRGSASTLPSVPNLPPTPPEAPVAAEPGNAPAASSPSSAPPPAADFEHASVTVGTISSLGLEEASVRRLLDSGSGRVARCYRDALKSGATHAQGEATLALETDVQGKVATATLRGIALPAPTARCIVDVFRNASVADDATGFGLAEATLAFALP